MISFRWHVILGLTVALAAVQAAHAQQSNPRIGYVFPAGGRQGSTFHAVIGGQFLAGASNVYVSGAGVNAAVVEHIRPLTQRELNDLREKLRGLQEKRLAAARLGTGDSGRSGSQPSSDPARTIKWTPEDEIAAAEIREKLSTFTRRLTNPSIAEKVTLQVSVAPEAEPGERELRLGTPLGLSNPLIFCVGQLPEFSEKEASGRATPQNVRDFRVRNERRGDTAPRGMTITLPAVVNGQIMPGEVDRFRFTARKGERLVVAASARQLIPYLPDAVPGWFQATLALYDAEGTELSYDDDYRFNPDPVLFYEIARDGEYAIEIKDSIFRGREDFIYRISLGELPFVTSIFPLGSQAGVKTTIEINGWNLARTSLEQDVKDKGPGIHALTVRKDEQVSNIVPFAVDTLVECLEKEPNSRQERAQNITLPVVVNGRIDQPGDWDVFRFQGRAGDEIVAEVSARRLNSPLDSVLKLTDAAGRQLAANDDHEDRGAGLTTHHADSWLSATLPRDGTWYLHLGDAQQKGGAEYAYRLRLSPPRPDFELRVAPSTINVRAGASIPITAHALRKDGFSDEIVLRLKGAPGGFILSGGRIPAQQDRVRFTLTAPGMPRNEPLNLYLEGFAIIRGQEVSRPGVPAEDMTQAFNYRHLVPAKELKVAVIGRANPRAPVKILSQTPARIPAGGTTRVLIAAPPGWAANQVEFVLSEPPDGIAIQSVSPSREGMEIVLQSDPTKAKPGIRGNLIVTASAGKAAAAKTGPQGNQRRLPLATLPAIPFEVVP